MGENSNFQVFCPLLGSLFSHLVRLKDKAKLHKDTSLCQQWDVGGNLVKLKFDNMCDITSHFLIKSMAKPPVSDGW